MTDFIPLVVEPYPDELLYSWIKRLADLNLLSIEIFVKKYFGDKGFGKGYVIPVDIRRGYLDFCDALNYDMDKLELYLQLSTTQFELMFYPQKLQTRLLHNVTRPDSKLNFIAQYFIKTPKVCKECMQEDMEKYGEHYFHRSHQLSGVSVCYKHHTKLYEVKRYSGKRDHKQLYNFEDLTEMIEEITEYDINYAEYAYQLLKQDICTHSNEIASILLKKAKAESGNKGFTKKQFVEDVTRLLNDATRQDKWSKVDSILPPIEAIPVMMHYFPDVNDFISELTPYKLIITKQCSECGNTYYTTQYAIDTGWGCSHCDHLLGEQKLFKRLVKIGGNGEYQVKHTFQNSSQKVLLYHKVCGEDFWVEPGDFIFRHTRCKCNQRLIRKEADRKMKKYPDFKLIEFNGAAQPAVFYHEECGESFKLVTFRDFLENPKCRCCEIPKDVTQEIFEQEVRDVVGDEYTVIGQVTTRDERVLIRHNTCGHIQNIKVIDFLRGSRCEKCYEKTSLRKLKVMLQEYSNGRYEIVSKDNYRYIVKDNNTGRTFPMFSKQIVQEIIRPTPSPVLPIENAANINSSLSTWDFWYQLLIQYKNEFGHVCPQRDEKYQGYALGDWCGVQRLEYNKNVLSDAKCQLLQEIDFVFNAPLYYWNKRFEEYKAYVAETGNMNPLQRIVHNGNKVGKWVRNQRHEEAKGKLNPTYKEILLEFNPDFFKPRQIKKNNSS